MMTELTDTERETLAEVLTEVLREHRPDGWVCTCGWPLNDSVGSVVDHLAEQITPLMRCPDEECRLFPGHDGDHGDGGGVVWRAALAAHHEHRLGATCWCGWSGFETPADEAAALAAPTPTEVQP